MRMTQKKRTNSINICLDVNYLFNLSYILGFQEIGKNAYSPSYLRFVCHADIVVIRRECK